MTTEETQLTTTDYEFALRVCSHINATGRPKVWGRIHHRFRGDKAFWVVTRCHYQAPEVKP